MKQIDSGGKSPKKLGPGIDKAVKYLSDHVQAAAVIAILCAVLCYAGFTAFQGSKQESGVPDVPGVEDGTGPAASGTPSSDPGTGGNRQDPFNGLDIAPEGDGYVGDGYDGAGDAERYWCVTPKTREKWHRISVPYGWSAQAVTGGIRIKPSDFQESTTDSEPVTFWWDIPASYEELSESGYCDMIGSRGSRDYTEDAYYVTDYYMTDDGYGKEYPVYVVRHVRKADPGSEYAEGLDEYAFYVAKPFKNGDASLFFVGTVQAYAFQSMSTPRFPTVEDLVREMFPPSSEPGFPSGWTWGQSVQEDQGTDDGADADPADGSDGAEDAPDDIAVEDGTAPEE